MSFQNWISPEIKDGQPTQYQWIVRHKDNFRLGKYTDIGAFTYINAKHTVTLEDHVQIGSHCSIYTCSTIDNKDGPVTLKRNCRIGTHSVIMPGVTIGENSVIGAFSFVTRDIPADIMAYGVPAKIIRKLSAEEKERFAEGGDRS